MISQCCVCKIVEGVKCPECGDFLKEEKPDVNRPLSAYQFNTYFCTNTDCNHVYLGEEGGVSHGMCQACMNARLREAGIVIETEDEFHSRIDRIAEEIDQRGLRQVLGNYNIGNSVEEQR